MEIVYLILALYALGFTGLVAGVVYLIFRRNRLRKKENFEKRSN